MTEPKRWLDPDSGAPPRIRELLENVRAPRALTRERRERVHCALRNRFGKSVTRIADCLSIDPGTFIMVTTSAMAVAYFVVSVLSPRDYSVAVRSVTVRSEYQPSARIPQSVPEPQVAPAKAPEPAISPVEEPAAVPSEAVAVPSEAKVEEPARKKTRKRARRRSGTRRAAAKRRAEDRIAALVDDILKPDARLLEKAREKLARDPATSLRLIREYRKRYPEAAVPIPSALVEVTALRMLGRVDEALAHARALADRVPLAYYLPEVDRYFAEL